MSSLLTIKGYNTGVRYSIDEETTTIGRAVENSIQLLDDNVSRFHAEVRRNRLAFTVFDMKSRNGIFVNGKKVEEKLLRRNDEIVIGSTHLLFDSDFELKNTLFSNKSLYMSAPADETIYDAIDQGRLEQLEEYRISGLRLIERISNLIATSEVELSTVTQEILAMIVELVGAQRGVLMRWDPISQELVPLAALCEEDQLAVNRGIVQQTFHEGKAILTSDVEIDLRYAEDPKATQGTAAVICAPLGTEKLREGVLYVDSDRRDAFGLRDVAMLVAVGRLFSVAFRVAGMHDRYEALGPAATEMIGKSRAIQSVCEQAARIAPVDTPVLITGETGTGKELLAREIHVLSPRSEGPFIAINCSAIPETLFESELFGYEKGAFTGADRLTRGKIEVASGGTVFLDEIGEMALAVQPKLLRFLQNQVFFRVGGTRPIRSNVRIIAATNASLREQSDQGLFRADLMYRLAVVELHLPALRERRDDVPLLVRHFLKRFSNELKKPVRDISEEALAYLTEYAWPGNIREMANCLERAILLTDRPTLDVADFALSLQAGSSLTQGRTAAPDNETRDFSFSPYRGTLADVEKAHIQATLERNSWNQVRSAEELGIHRNTLRNKIQEYGLARRSQ